MQTKFPGSNLVYPCSYERGYVTRGRKGLAKALFTGLVLYRELIRKRCWRVAARLATALQTMSRCYLNAGNIA